MKKMLTSYCAGPAYYRMCSTDVYCSKQTGSSSNQRGNHHPSFLRFWNWGRRKPSMQPKFVAAQKMLLKQKNPANIRKWIARFYYLAFIPAEARVYCLHTGMSCPSIGNPHLHCRPLIYFWVPSSCFASTPASL